MSLRPSHLSISLIATALLTLAPLSAEAQPQRQGREGPSTRSGGPDRQRASGDRNRSRNNERRVERPDRSRGNDSRAHRSPPPDRRRGSDRRVDRPRHSPPPARAQRHRDSRRDHHVRAPRHAPRAHVSTHHPRWKYHGHRYRRPYVIPVRPALRAGGRWELHTREVWVPAYTDQIWVEGECYLDAYGATLCEPGQWVWHSFDGFYEPRQEWVWVPHVRPGLHVHF